MVKIQNVLPSQVEPRLDEKMNRVSTSNSPDSQNVHKSTNDTSSEDIINITTSHDKSKEDNESILPPTTYSNLRGHDKVTPQKVILSREQRRR